jgi:CRISPR-associated endonuclease Csn1
MKKILGLDLGTNSIGWAVVNAEKKRDNEELKPISIEAANSRIIPMDAATLGDFDKGNSVSQTKERTAFRGNRRLRERVILRRERLLRVLDLMGFLPEHFSSKLTRYGKFTDESEPKLAWKMNSARKYEFLFTKSFEEMVCEFKKTQPTIKNIPYDWTIYYLRKKALSKALTKEELAWIILNFNQKRGYYQLRGEDKNVDSTKETKFYALKVVSVENTGNKKNDGSIFYNVHLENGMVYSRTSKEPLDWEGKIKEFIVTTDLNKDGTYKTDKYGNIKRSFRAPNENDWALLKIKTESDIHNSGKSIGCYIYDSLINNPQQKIIGKLVRTVERKFYKDELRNILEKQKEFIPELNDRDLYKKCLNELYHINETHRDNAANRDFTYLFIEDIIFYQRPLKSKKSLISDCPYEKYSYESKDKNNETQTIYLPIKCIAKSNPLFQEFRLWQFVLNLKIYQREKVINGKLYTDIDVTNEFFKSEDDYTALFDWLNNRTSIEQDILLGSYFKIKKQKDVGFSYRWNYVEEKVYPCNETRSKVLDLLKKAEIDASFLTSEIEEQLWHVMYSVEDKYDYKKAIEKFALKHSLSDKFVEVFSSTEPFEKEYGAYSAKAIKKLLTLMRMGKYWNEENIDECTRERIDKLINGEHDNQINDRVREKTAHLTDISLFKGLPLWLACYVVYNRYSEAKEITKWESYKDIDVFLKNFKQHSLRNPIVEQVIIETLRTVRDIWKQVETIDEIHIELGREMKNPAEKRKKMYENIQENENTNLRIKAMLAEFQNPQLNVENVRPYSPMQQDLLKLYEEFALNNLSKDDKDFDFIRKVSKNAQPTKNDIIKYKSWLEQKYRSPYTGEIIPLSKLFTTAYEIEHIIPKARYFDDSFSNKVICESEVNKLKSSQLGYEFICNQPGRIVTLSGGKTVKIFTPDEYEAFVKSHFTGTKKKKLLMTDIPDSFIERQLNDSRYISKYIKGLLSNIVRKPISDNEYEQEAISKNVITCSGGVTDRLKKDWGMNDVWNKIVLPRFIRLNELTENDVFTAYNKEGHLIPNMPLELQKGFNKKRIDHRHHAMDAIVIACATRSHINYLNNLSARSDSKPSRNDLKHILCTKTKRDDKGNYNWIINKPWETFTTDAYNVLENMIVSFKQNLRVINKTVNKFEHYNENDKKVIIKQTKGDSWAIRKPLHKDTVFGEVNLRRIKEISLSDAIKNPRSIVDKEIKAKILELTAQGLKEKEIVKYFANNKDIWAETSSGKIKVYYFTKDTKERFFATRKALDASFTKEKIEKSITDTGIQKILLAHLENMGGKADLAFSPDGIDELNKNITILNGGKYHQPIYKVRVYEKADKFAVGTKGNKSKKFVEAAKGTNLFFVVYSHNKKDKINNETLLVRTFATAPLNMVIDCQKKNPKNWQTELDTTLKANGYVDENAKLLFILSPNDLVYLPTKEEIKDGITEIDKKRIYKFVSCTGNEAHFIPKSISSPIIQTIELGSNNKAQKAWTSEMIKETCLPLKTDRLGNIIALGEVGK